eukprot:TRINITY_DN11055_c0_g1_i1.p1 TRINITY_DN11055_c0_g1~~TRINITY_DN11055_c0_g1_i1.p1  ORF type:complete len:198 (+),score=40.50 TRINITY_DN11055_c0_g1_i1:51-644(+)
MPSQQDEQLRQRMENTLKMGDQAVNLSAQTTDCAAETQAELQRQRETLHRIDNGLDTIIDNSNTSQRIVTRMSSFFGGWIDYFKGAPPKKEDEPLPEKPNHKPSVGRTTSTATNTSGATYANVVGRDNVNLEVLGFLEKSDQQFDAIGANLETLHASALAMKSELDYHDHLLTRIEGKSEDARVAIKKNTRNINKML